MMLYENQEYANICVLEDCELFILLLKLLIFLWWKPDSSTLYQFDVLYFTTKKAATPFWVHRKLIVDVQI